MLTPERACLVIADISGYTGFLAGAELDHAQDILADLVGTVGRRSGRSSGSPSSRATPRSSTRSPRDRRADAPGHDRALLLRVPPAAPRHPPGVERASAMPASSSRTSTSRSSPTTAQVIRQRIGVVGGARRERRDRRPPAAEEPRRARTTGIDAYALYTDACVAAMGLDDPAAAGMVRAPRGVRGRRRGRRLGASTSERRGRQSWRGRGSPSSGPTRRSSTTRRSMRRRRSPGSTSPRRSGVPLAGGRRPGSAGGRPGRPPRASVP